MKRQLCIFLAAMCFAGVSFATCHFGNGVYLCAIDSNNCNTSGMDLRDSYGMSNYWAVASGYDCAVYLYN